MKILVVVASAAALFAAQPLSALAQEPAGAAMSPGPPADGPMTDGPMTDRPMREGAQPGSAHWSLHRREEWLQGRIDRATDRGWLSGNEISRGRTELQAIRSEQASLLARDGGALSPTDRRYLAQRINELNATLRWQGENPPPPWS
jgi:hypothetical protein